MRGLVLLVLALGVMALLSLALGSRPIPLGTVVEVLFHDDGSEAATIVHALRVPRTVLAITIGIALGVAGALMQGHTRNPLADPGLLGVEAGASCAVVLAIYTLGVDDLTSYAWFALAGAGIASAAVFAIGTSRGGPDPVSLVLAGAAMSALLLRSPRRSWSATHRPSTPTGSGWWARCPAGRCPSSGRCCRSSRSGSCSQR